MLRLYAPVAVALALIGSLTVWEAYYSDRLASSAVDAAEFGKRFASVPKQVGPWVGEDRKEQKETLEMAGAVSHVSRTYTNGETGQTVDLWLIVGHARDICRHTPDICYPSHGFSQMGSKVKQQIDPPGAAPAETFYTAKFRNDALRGGTMTRVFWAWNGNEEGKDKWEAPGESSSMFVTGNPTKLYYGNNKALYKMYFTAAMANKDEPASDNIALDFAKLMLPEINRALFPERYADEDAEAADEGDASEEAGLSDDEPAGETSGHVPASDVGADAAPIE